MRLPPSPALSACDSLDGIDDLDAFLDAQGSLSHFPTPPPPRGESLTQSLKITANSSDNEVSSAKGAPVSLDYAHIAIVLAEEASVDVHVSADDVEIIQALLIRAGLSTETVAFAFSILAGLHARVVGLGMFFDTPPDLLVVAALSLAVSYTSDHPPPSLWWASCVCNDTWTSKRIDNTIIHLFSTLGWQLHEYGNYEAIQQTVHRWVRYPKPEQSLACFGTQAKCTSSQSTPEKQPLRLLIDNVNNACLSFGQLTPEATPPLSAHEHDLGLRMPLMRFLPLL